MPGIDPGGCVMGRKEAPPSTGSGVVGRRTSVAPSLGSSADRGPLSVWVVFNGPRTE